MADALIDVKGLCVEFHTPKGISHIINDLSLTFEQDSFLGLVGESGSGKTVFAYSLLNYAKPPGVISKGEIFYKGEDVLKMSEEKLISEYRGKELGLIASNARAHLNPLMTVGQQLSTVYRVHTGAGKKESMERALEMLKLVKINDPERRLKAYPHELSGGMAQRIMIAMSLINNPRVIIADDCTNGLDVTVAAQIMDLFQEVIETQHSSGIMITHDLGIVAQCCSHIAIIYCGQIIETAKVVDFFAGCRHPYSQMLLDSLPENVQKAEHSRLTGMQNDPYNLPSGCLFFDRCPYRKDRCREEIPSDQQVGDKHIVKCHYPLER